MALIETNPHGYRHIALKYLGGDCYLCGEDKITKRYSDSDWFKAALDIHHIIHVKDGGDNKIGNLAGLCSGKEGCHVRIHRLCQMVKNILNCKGVECLPEQNEMEFNFER